MKVWDLHIALGASGSSRFAVQKVQTILESLKVNRLWVFWADVTVTKVGALWEHFALAVHPMSLALLELS